MGEPYSGWQPGTGRQNSASCDARNCQTRGSQRQGSLLAFSAVTEEFKSHRAGLGVSESRDRFQLPGACFGSAHWRKPLVAASSIWRSRLASSFLHSAACSLLRFETLTPSFRFQRHRGVGFLLPIWPQRLAWGFAAARRVLGVSAKRRSTKPGTRLRLVLLITLPLSSN